ncbi:MAG: hypothetical protein ACKOPI_06005, partial [bacterium]
MAGTVNPGLSGVLAELRLEPGHAHRPFLHHEDGEVALDHDRITAAGKPQEQVVIHRVPVLEAERPHCFEGV